MLILSTFLALMLTITSTTALPYTTTALHPYTNRKVLPRNIGNDFAHILTNPKTNTPVFILLIIAALIVVFVVILVTWAFANVCKGNKHVFSCCGAGKKRRGNSCDIQPGALLHRAEGGAGRHYGQQTQQGDAELKLLDRIREES